MLDTPATDQHMGANILEHLQAQFSRVRMSEDDFAEAKSYLALYDAAQLPDIRRALLTAAVVAYSRPFKNNDNGGGRTSPHVPINPAKVLQPKEATLHQQIIRLRDSAVAHSLFETRGMVRTGGAYNGHTCAGRVFDILILESEQKRFLDMATLMWRHSIERLSQLNAKIVSLEDQQIGR
jgi:hypothetical protein